MRKRKVIVLVKTVFGLPKQIEAVTNYQFMDAKIKEMDGRELWAKMHQNRKELKAGKSVTVPCIEKSEKLILKEFHL